MKYLFFLMMSLQPISNVHSQETDISGFVKIKNFYKVDEGVYRSAQPNSSDFKDLEKAGIKEVLNLRNHHSDDKEAKNTNIQLSRVKMNAGSLKEEDLLEAMKIIRDRKGPIVIHCWHGSDRTGAVIAMYRMIYQGWSKEDAIHELVNGNFGHHEKYYKNIPALLHSIDVDLFKGKLNLLK